MSRNSSQVVLCFQIVLYLSALLNVAVACFTSCACTSSHEMCSTVLFVCVSGCCSLIDRCSRFSLPVSVWQSAELQDGIFSCWIAGWDFLLFIEPVITCLCLGVVCECCSKDAAGVFVSASVFVLLHVGMCLPIRNVQSLWYFMHCLKGMLLAVELVLRGWQCLAAIFASLLCSVRGVLHHKLWL